MMFGIRTFCILFFDNRRQGEFGGWLWTNRQSHRGIHQPNQREKNSFLITPGDDSLNLSPTCTSNKTRFKIILPSHDNACRYTKPHTAIENGGMYTQWK